MYVVEGYYIIVLLYLVVGYSTVFFQIRLEELRKIQGKKSKWSDSQSSSSSVALQPRSGLGLPYGFHNSYSTMWAISSTIDLVLHTLIQPSETSSSSYQRL
jgi:hypothetical protein